MSDTKMAPGGIAFGPTGAPVRGVQHVEIAQALEVEVKRQRQRAEAAERDAASLRDRIGALAAKFAEPGTTLDTQEKYLAREVLRLLSAPSSSPAAADVTQTHISPVTGEREQCRCAPSPAATGPRCEACDDTGEVTPLHYDEHGRHVLPKRPCPKCRPPASPSPGESDATTTSNEEG